MDDVNSYKRIAGLINEPQLIQSQTMIKDIVQSNHRIGAVVEKRGLGPIGVRTIHRIHWRNISRNGVQDGYLIEQ